MKQNSYQTTTLVATSLLLLLATPSIAPAQILPDHSLPNNSIITPNSNVLQIDGGTSAGSNLFHSFQEFSVPTGNEAFFNNATNINNIITRVTGENISNIDGLIRANGGANLFLINPNGIVFGPNARLDIGGSFLGSTAESLLFDDGSVYSAIAPEAPPLLTINLPVGLQMGQNSGAIQVANSGHQLQLLRGIRAGTTPLDLTQNPVGLQVDADRTLALVGGSIDLTGGVVVAPGGDIELGAVERGSVRLDATSGSWEIDYDRVETFADVRLSDRALLDASAPEPGAIRVRSRNIDIADSSAIFLQNQGELPSGSIDLHASDTISIRGNLPDADVPSTVYTQALGAGRGADIEIVARQFHLEETAVLLSRNFGDGAGGNISLAAVDEITISSGVNLSASALVSTISAGTFGAGDAGAISIATQQLKIRDGSTISSVAFGGGNGGNLSIQASETIEVVGATPQLGSGSSIAAVSTGNGNAGDANLRTARLVLRDGGEVTASTAAAGNSGTISIVASESIEVTGTNLEGQIFSRVASSAEGASAFLRNALGLPEFPSGNSGNVEITTPELRIGNGGLLSVNSTGTGEAGNLQIDAGVIVANDASLSASTFSGNGGNIAVQTNALQLRHNSEISTEAQGTGNGGNITIDTVNLVLLEDSDITANAEAGQGGNILITTEGIFVSPDSSITASSQFGIDGIVQINNPDVDSTQGIVELSQTPVEASDRVVSGCGADALENSFAFIGRGGLPPNPSQQLISDRPWTDLRDLSTLRGQNTASTPEANTTGKLVEANGWMVHPDGKIELVALVDNSRSPQFPFNCAAQPKIPSQLNVGRGLSL